MIKHSKRYNVKVHEERKRRLRQLSVKEAVRQLEELLRAGSEFLLRRVMPLPIALAQLLKKR